MCITDSRRCDQIENKNSYDKLFDNFNPLPSFQFVNIIN